VKTTTAKVLLGSVISDWIFE